MSEHSLEELQRLSMSALRHAELVDLARTLSPKRAYEVALSRWPRRQAKAARYLSVMHRDFPDAFDVFLSRVGCARPNGTEYTHQGDATMNVDSVYPEGVQNVVFVHSRSGADSLQVRHITEGGAKHTDFPLSDRVSQLGLDDEGTRVLVQRILESMLAQWATPKAQQFFYGEMWGSALLAARTHLAGDQDLHRRLLISCVIYNGGHTKYVLGLIRNILPDPSEESTLQDVIDFMLGAGCTEAQIREAWKQMLATRLRSNFKTSYITEYWEDLKIGDGTFKAEAEPVARALMLRELDDFLVKGQCNGLSDMGDPKVSEGFMKLLEFLLHGIDYNWLREDEELHDLVEDRFIHCLAKGWVGTATYMLHRFGRNFRLWSEYGSKAEEKPLGAIKRLMRAAVQKAEEDESFGVASALAEHIGEIYDADRLRARARDLEQPVALDYAFFVSNKD